VRFGPRVYYRLVPPKKHGHAVAKPKGSRFAEAARRFNRQDRLVVEPIGQHEIYLLDLRGKAALFEKLTDDPHVDSFRASRPTVPRSPSTVAARPGFPIATPSPADVWLMDSDGRGARRVAERGFHATVSCPDGRALIFAALRATRPPQPDDGREGFSSIAGKELGGSAQEPDVRDQRIAVTIRGRCSARSAFTTSAREVRVVPR